MIDDDENVQDQQHATGVPKNMLNLSEISLNLNIGMDTETVTE